MSSFRFPQVKTFTCSEREPRFDIRSESIGRLSKFQFLVDKKLLPESFKQQRILFFHFSRAIDIKNLCVRCHNIFCEFDIYFPKLL